MSKATSAGVAIYDSFFFVHHYALTIFSAFVTPKYPRFARTSHKNTKVVVMVLRNRK